MSVPRLQDSVASSIGATRNNRKKPRENEGKTEKENKSRSVVRSGFFEYWMVLHAAKLSMKFGDTEVSTT